MRRSRTLPLLLVLASSLGSLAGCGEEDPIEPPSPATTESAPGPGTPARLQAEGAGPAMLIDVDTLKADLADPRLRIVDTRRADEYATGHIAGAVHVDLARWKEKSLADGGLQETDFWAGEVGRLGISADSRVVVCGETVPSTARTWWLLRYVGLDDVRILEGSWRQWQRKYYPVDREVPEVAPARFTPRFRTHLLAPKKWVMERVGSDPEGLELLDARSHGEYTGQDAAGTRGGHIPGAISLEWKEVVDEAGHFLPADELRDLFRQHGIDDGARPVAYCRTGARSSVLIVALRLAGFRDVTNYYRGWHAWSQDEEAPVEEDH